MARIVVAGSGFAGVEAVRVLGLLGLCRSPGVECIWATPRPVLSFLPYAPAVAGARKEPEELEIGVERLAEWAGFTLVEKRVTALRPGTVVLEGGEELEYTHVLVAAGARPAFYGVEGADTVAIPLYSIRDAARLRDRAGEAETVAIVGAGFVGVETAAELLERARREQRKQRVVLVDLLREPLGLLRNPAASRLAEKILREMGAEFAMGEPAARIDSQGVVLRSGRRVEADLVVWSAGFQGPGIEAPSESLGRGRFLQTDPYLRVRGLPGAYAAGDAAWITRSDGCCALKMAREALRSGATAAVNIAAELKGEKTLTPYRPLLTNCVPQAGIMLGPERGIMVLGKNIAFESRIPHLYHDRILEEYQRLLQHPETQRNPLS